MYPAPPQFFDQKTFGNEQVGQFVINRGKLPAGATLYVMNSNYLEEIKQMSNNAYRYVSVDHD